MALRRLQMAFSGGEVTPEFWGQIDDSKFQTGLARCENALVLPHGPIANREGFAMVREVKFPTRRTRIIEFTYSTDQTMVIELGHLYARFHTDEATLMDGPDPYEIVTPYDEADLFDIAYVQSADVITLAHQNYPVSELRRLGALSWVLSEVIFASTLSAPTGVSATPVGSGTTTDTYVVTALKVTGLEESATSAEVTATNDLLTTGNYNHIAWSAVTDAFRYNIFKKTNGLFGYIGQTEALSFDDTNLVANMGKTPPIQNDPFNAPGKYPGAVSYFEQRRCFAGSIDEPQNLRMTRSGTEANMTYAIPSKDDDMVNIRVAAREANTIRHIVPLATLVLLTAAAEWRVTSVNSDAITPTSISVKPQSYIGASRVQPVIVNNNIIYGASRGGHMREMAFNYNAGGYVTGDMSLRAPHLFDGKTIVDLAASKAPFPVIWAVSSDGKLIGVTYVPEQQLGAIHQHTTAGQFESVCVVSEGAEDAVYVVVNRTIDGVQSRYVERKRARATGADAFFVDSGATYSGAATSTISGLDWLEGAEVSILADGAVHPPRVVVGGEVTLDYPCTKAQIGLPYATRIHTLPIAAQVDAGFLQGTIKNVNQIWPRFYETLGGEAGPSLDRMTPLQTRSTEPYGSPPAPFTGEKQVTLDPAWADGGQLYIEQNDPVPLTLVALTVEVETGG